MRGSHVRSDLAQEARAVRERADAEQLGERLAEIGERRARPEVDAGAHARRRSTSSGTYSRA